MARAFISYKSEDRAEATRLRDELVALGHTVWLDVENIGIGDSIVGQIQSGLAGTAYLILCFSSADRASPWVDLEWMSTLARQLGGVHVTILPARLTGGRPPAILHHLRYADLVADWDRGVRELHAAMRRPPAGPTSS